MKQTAVAGPDQDSGPAAGMVLAEFVDVGRSFGAQRALDSINLQIRAGEVHALIGENGAGKSTLGKILSGSLGSSDGALLVHGRPVQYRGPADALHDGIVTMAQEISLAPHLTVLDNVLLGRERGRWGFVQHRSNLARFHELQEETGFELDPMVRAGTLPIAMQQEVEIMRALARDARLIVMDEPTAALPGSAAEKLYSVVRRLRDRGTSVVFISHFLEEVLELSDRVSVLRNGHLVATEPAETATVGSLVRHMLGRSLDANYPDRVPVPDGAPVVLRARGVRSQGAAAPVDLDVRAGEVLGIFGLVGSGRSELAMTLFGARPGEVESIAIDGVEFRPSRPRSAMEAGLMVLPESRKDQGLFLGMGQAHNASVSHLELVSSFGFVSRSKERAMSKEVLSKMGVDPVDLAAPVAQLSGGNQQKVLFAKCLFKTPRVLILDEPTRGVDVGSRRAIYDRIVELVTDGMAVVVISSEFDEVSHLAHRLVVMRDGAVVAEFDPEVATHDEVLNAAFGVDAGQESR